MLIPKLSALWNIKKPFPSLPSFDCWQDLVEKVMVLRKAVEMSRGQAPDIPSGYLSDRLTRYAGLLAAQGSIFTAISYLRNTSEVSQLFNNKYLNIHLLINLFTFSVPCNTNKVSQLFKYTFIDKSLHMQCTM